MKKLLALLLADQGIVPESAEFTDSAGRTVILPAEIAAYDANAEIQEYNRLFYGYELSEFSEKAVLTQ